MAPIVITFSNGALRYKSPCNDVIT